MFSIALESFEVKENEEAAQALVDDFNDLLGRSWS